MSDLGIGDAYRFDLGVGAELETPLDKLIQLRTLPNLSGLAASGLAFIAQVAVERRFRAGEALYTLDRAVEHIHFLVEGRVSLEQEGVQLDEVAAPWPIGFFPILGTRGVRQRAVALEDTVTLSFHRDELLELLTDDFVFLENGMRQVGRQLALAQRELEERGELTRTEPEEVEAPQQALDLIHRIQVVSEGPFANAGMEAILKLARSMEEQRFEAGHVFWGRGEPPREGFNIVSGVVRCDAPRRSFVMGPGSSIGYLEAYGALERDYRAVAETPVVVLRDTVEAFFDVLEDHADLALTILRFLTDALMDRTLQLARLRSSSPTTSEAPPR